MSMIPPLFRNNTQLVQKLKLCQTHIMIFDYEHHQHAPLTIPSTSKRPLEEYFWLDSLEQQLFQILASDASNDHISHDILNKYNSLTLLALRSQEIQDIIQIRVHQLAIANILTKCHGHTLFFKALSHMKLGQAYLIDECFEQACQHFQQATLANDKYPNTQRKANLYRMHVLNHLAYSLTKLDKLEEAEEISAILNELVSMADLNPSQQYEANILFEILSFQILFQSKKDRSDTALELLEKQTKMNGHISWRKVSSAWLNIVQIEIQLHEYEKAIQSQTKLIQLYKEQSQLQLEVFGLSRLAHIHEQREQFEYGQRYYQMAYDLAHDKGLPIKLSFLKIKLFLCQERINLGMAIKTIAALISEEEKIDESEIKVGWLYLKLGQALKAQGKYMEANIKLKKAKKFYQFFSDKKMLARVQKALKQ